MERFKSRIAIIIILIIALMTGVGARIARADTSSYTSAVEDLYKDVNFEPEKYPIVTDDYSLNVIQIAESKESELLIYVYQPAGDKGITAKSINIAKQPNGADNLSFKNYRLNYLNSAGVFFKYLVTGFELETTTTRNYNISNILRSYNSEIDGKPSEGQTVTEVPNKVGQLWTVTTTANGEVKYVMDTTEVIEITQKVVGYCLYDDGLNVGWGAMQGATKAYFVAFDTDKPIDKLISAELSFWAQKSKFKVCGNQAAHDHDYLYDMHDVETICYGVDTDYGENTVHEPPLTIKHTQKFSNQGGGNWVGRPANRYEWNRIRSTSDFISDNNNDKYTLTGSDKQKLSDTKWVLNFYEAHDRYLFNNVWLSFIPGVTQIPGVGDGEAQFEFAYDVSILRLEFETEGRHYNLGVVDNKQTGNEQFGEPIINGGCNALLGLKWWAWLIIVIVSPVTIFVVFKLLKKVFTKRAGTPTGARSKRTKAGTPTNTVGKTSKRSKGKNSKK